MKKEWYLVIQQAHYADRTGVSRVRATGYYSATKKARALAPEQLSRHHQFRVLAVAGPFKEKPDLKNYHKRMECWDGKEKGKSMRARVVMRNAGLKLRLLDGLDETDCITNAGLQVGDEITLTVSDRKPTWTFK